MHSAIVVLTCPKYHARAQACREAWADASCIPVYFLTGSDLCCPETDEDYWLLPVKTREMARWAVLSNFQRIYKCDDDVMVVPENINPPDGNYSGHYRPDKPGPSYASGFFYKLSREALNIIADAPLPPPDLWAEDMWVGRSLFAAGIPVVADERVCWGFDETIRGRNLRRIHPQFCAAADFRPEVMKQFAQELKSGRFWKEKFLKAPQNENWDNERMARRHAKLRQQATN